jgi:transposase
MNYTQNDKIMSITENTLIVGVDIAKHVHYARAFNYRGVEVGKILSFTNSLDGLDSFMKWIEDLSNVNGKDNVIIGMEPTGHYWFNLGYFLIEKDIRLVVVNPFHVSRSKELDDNTPTKNDRKDPKTIAKLVIDGRYSEPNMPAGNYSDLRIAVKLRENINKSLNRIKNNVTQWLDKYFPEFNNVFADWAGKAALMTLRHFPTPNKVLNNGVVEIVSMWRKSIKRSVGPKKAVKLLEAAQSSIGVKEGLEMAEIELNMLLEQYDMFIKQFEILEEKIENIVLNIPGVNEILVMKGIGIMSISSFLSEVGDINKYNHPSQIQKIAGFNLKESSSGKHKGQTTISKRGRPGLRAGLFKTIMPVVANNKEFKELHKYYTTRSNNPLKKKQSLIVLCCKLIRVFFAVLTKQVPYDSQKLIKDIKRPQVQEKEAA